MIECIDAGLVRYQDSLIWQKKLARKRRIEEVSDSLLLLEHHPPVFTSGRRDASEDLLVTEDWILKNGMEIYKTDRGGRMTYHGPGQLVGYLIFEVKDPIPTLVRKIEETLMRLLAFFHINAERDPKYPGIWIENRKIAAIGLHIDRRISTHGFSLNVSCDLKPFQYIHPCGIKDREVTSLERELGWRPSMRDVKHLLLGELAKVFQTSITVGGTASAHSE